MTAYRYGLRAVAPDYLRCAAGLAFTAGPLALLPLAPVVAWTVAPLAALFALHGVRTAIRHATTIECDDEGIAARGLPARRIGWTELKSLRLRHFTTRRDGAGGWMQLVLRGPACTIRVESTLVGFEEIVTRAVAAARASGLGLSAATLSNLDVLGLSSGFPRPASGDRCPTC